jgi:uncharacterized protein (TIGR02145 family)
MNQTMKHFFTLMALLLTSVTFGQETCNNVFDYNDNNTIDIEDFLAILGLFADVDLDDDGTWDSLDNCLDLSACNYASELNEPCTYLPPGDCDCNGNVLDECGVCGGTGLAPGTCDCDGTLIDVIGVCGGDCWVDEDEDGICDDVDECVGEYDACDVCNGPGAIYECGCANIPEGECDCDGNVLDAVGVCGGACSADEDADGVCDDVDDCVGEFDVCGVCNGPGEVYECGCGDVPEGECDCEGNVLDALGECGGECLADEDGDGVCDDVDDCVGEFDECGVCNGDGAVYECGCNDIPEGECDCDGNVFDECGVCNGPGPTEIVIEDIITLYDSVYLPFDDAWYVYPVDADTTFGFTCAPSLHPCGDPVSYQGYNYATVQIGEQCWFAENLRSELYLNGDSIPAGLSDSEWASTSGAVAVYGEGNTLCFGADAVNGDACDESWSLIEYGRLYNWYAVDDNRGLCPSGWHVPTDAEWTVMTNELGGADVAQPHMISTYGWHYPGTNSSGFSGLPGGERKKDSPVDVYTAAGSVGFWWSSSLYDSSKAHARSIYNLDWPIESVGAPRKDLHRGLSVRCIQNAPEALGCTDTSACNYDELANTDDGSCEYESCAPSFEACGDPVSYQGYDYATVQIGDQCWFAENLRSELYVSGDSIAGDLVDAEWSSTSSGAVAVYGEGNSTCSDDSPEGVVCDESWSLDEYGRVYNWYAVDDARGLCPSGWHVPTDEEWTLMTDHLGGASVAGVQMKTDYGWDTGGNGTNTSGFSGLPGGYRAPNGSFVNGGGRGYWWTSSPMDLFYAIWRRLSGGNDIIGGGSFFRDGYSVRCIQDIEE